MHAANLMRVPHFSGHVGMGGIFDFGYTGVDFFFVLSGFIISYVHREELGRPGRLPEYLWRRVSRIYPIFWVALLIDVSITVARRLATGKDLQLGWQPIDWLGTVALLQVAEPRFVGVAWTLQYELMFYFIFGLLFLHRRIGLLAMGLWAVAILAMQALGATPTGNGALHVHCLQFILGIGVGLGAGRGLFDRLGARSLVLALGLLLVVQWLEQSSWGPHHALGRIALGLVSALLLAVLVSMERRRTVRTPRFLAVLGSASYSLYLTHITFINLLYGVLLQAGLYHRLPEPLLYAMGVGTALALGLLVGLRIELPLVRLLKGWFNRRRRTAAAQRA